VPLFLEFETERLTVAHWAETIAVQEARRSFATQLPDLLTPDVIAHLPPFFDLTDQNMDQWIDARDAESDIYLIREKGTDVLIGLMFLTPSFNNDIHLEYLLG
jgi:ribosomal-protein-alanine N-acetyltransferase